MEDDLKKNKKNGRRPKKIKKMKTTKKKKWKTTKTKMEDEPINQNQPNWLQHHCKFT